MKQPVTLKYTPTQEDYAAVLRLYFWQRSGTKLSLVALVVAFGLVLAMLLTKGSPPTIFELIWLLLPPLFVAFMFLIQPSRLAKQAVQNEKLITESTWQVGAPGVEISSKYGSTLLEWEALARLVRTKDYFLLLSKDNKNAFRFIPKRAFDTPQAETEFLELVAEYIPLG